MPKNTPPRPSRTPSSRNAKCQDSRRRLAVSETQLEQALIAGLEWDEIAARFKVSRRTVARRIAEARRRHGPGWPVGAKPPKTLAPALAPPKTSIAWADLVNQAKHVHAVAMSGAKVPASALAAARTILTSTPPTEQKPVVLDRGELLTRLRAGAAAIPPEPEDGPQLH